MRMVSPVAESAPIISGGHDGQRRKFQDKSAPYGAVARVVAPVVAGRSTAGCRVVFGNAGFNLTHKVGTDVGCPW